jgi:hypothetical protein
MSSLYPLWIEKLIFLLLIAGGIYSGLLLGSYLSGVLLWVTRICMLPIVILVASEGIGRIVQSIYSK